LFKGLGTNLKLLTIRNVRFHWNLFLGPLSKVALNLLALSLLLYSMFLGTLAKHKLLIPFEKFIKLLPHYVMKRKVKNNITYNIKAWIHPYQIVYCSNYSRSQRKRRACSLLLSSLSSFFYLSLFLSLTFFALQMLLGIFFLNHIWVLEKKRCNPKQDFKQLKTSKFISNAHWKSWKKR